MNILSNNAIPLIALKKYFKSIEPFDKTIINKSNFKELPNVKKKYSSHWDQEIINLFNG